MGGYSGRDYPALKAGYSESETVLYSPEIIEDDMHVGLGDRLPIQLGINDPSTGFDGGIVPEIVRCLENDPDRIQGVFDPSEMVPGRSCAAAPNDMAFIADILQPILDRSSQCTPSRDGCREPESAAPAFLRDL
jgi:hypothetical protein